MTHSLLILCPPCIFGLVNRFPVISASDNTILIKLLIGEIFQCSQSVLRHLNSSIKLLIGENYFWFQCSQCVLRHLNSSIKLLIGENYFWFQCSQSVLRHLNSSIKLLIGEMFQCSQSV